MTRQEEMSLISCLFCAVDPHGNMISPWRRHKPGKSHWMNQSGGFGEEVWHNQHLDFTISAATGFTLCVSESQSQFDPLSSGVIWGSTRTQVAYGGFITWAEMCKGYIHTKCTATSDRAGFFSHVSSGEKIRWTWNIKVKDVTWK